MELKEAREIAVEIGEFGLAYTTNKIKEAAIILNNQITELEAEMKQVLKEFDEVEVERDKLKKKVKTLIQTIRHKEANLN